MSEDGISEGAVSRDEIAELAALFDRFEFAFDPRAMAAKEAESEFENKVHQIFTERVEHPHPGVTYTAFHSRVKSLCRIYLKKNAP